tara:strand:- start:890 stop:1261 length:372 start_codon:yes stop_codon:yes gene_type:complete
MPTKRTVDLITEAFSDVMTSRRKYKLKKPNGELLKEIYFPPLTRFDRIQAQAAAGTDEALAISTRLLCQLAQNEDGTKAFHSADAENLKRFLPETVLNELELFMMDIKVDLDTAKNESGEITG